MDKKSEEEEFTVAHQEYAALLSNMKTVTLGTVSPIGNPDASYAPAFVDADRHFYVYISALAKHTGNLKQSKKGSVMIIEDESASSELFARRRVTFQCTAETIERDSEPWAQYIKAFEEKFGSTMSYLKSMTDFDLIKLTPTEGRLVLGFGRAYRVSGEQMATLGYFGGSGHKQKG